MGAPQTEDERRREEAITSALHAACLAEIGAHVTPILNQAIEANTDSYVLVDTVHRLCADMLGGVLVATAIPDHEMSALETVLAKIKRTLAMQDWPAMRARARRSSCARCEPAAPVVPQ